MATTTRRKTEYRRTLRLFKRLMQAYATPPEMTVSQWADEYRVLSPEASAERGRWRTDRAPYQREILDAVGDARVERVVVKSSAQVGKTEILLNAIGYYMDYDPAPMLYIQPTEDMAEAFSKDRLAPMLRDCPTLSGKVLDTGDKRKGNTTFHKSFPGGHITMIGANAPSKLASRPIRVLLLDEVDRFPVSAGREGDPVALAVKRTATFWNRKILEVSTPTIKGESRIDKDFDSSTAEELEVACPQCGAYQEYAWEQLKFEHESGSDEAQVLGFVCKECGALSKEAAWKRQPIRWVAKYPGRKWRGFHLNELASPWKRWDELVEDFLRAKHDGVEAMKVWHNTALGLSWEERGELDMDELLLRRRQMYNCQVPGEVLVLTAAVDVQDNRLEYEIVGWGAGKKSWGIQYGVIMGDPGQLETWTALDDVLFDNYIRADGQQLQVMTTCVDSGGHYTSEVYAYCRARESRRVWAIKGRGGAAEAFLQRPKSRHASGAWLFTIGVDVGKDTLSSRLQVQFPEHPGYCAFPMESGRGYDAAYFEGLTAERRVTHTQSGRPVARWEKRSASARNEPWDIRNYNQAALEILNPNLDTMERRRLGEVEQPATAAPKPQRRRQPRSIEIW